MNQVEADKTAKLFDKLMRMVFPPPPHFLDALRLNMLEAEGHPYPVRLKGEDADRCAICLDNGFILTLDGRKKCLCI